VAVKAEFIKKCINKKHRVRFFGESGDGNASKVYLDSR
jgi:hypothetical protein